MKRSLILILVSTALVACGQQHSNTATMAVVAPSTLPTLGKVVAGDGQLTEYVRRIFQDSKGNYWFGSNGDGIYHYVPDAGLLEVFSTDEGLAGHQVTGILEDRKGDIWISTNGGVSRFDPSAPLGTNAFTNYTTKEGLPSNGCWSIYEARDGAIWVGTGTGVCRSRPEAKPGDGAFFEPLALPAVGGIGTGAYWIACITQDSGGDLWFATRGEGALRYDGRAVRWFDVTEGLGDNELACIREASTGGLWISSMNKGLAHFNGKAVEHFAAPDDIGNNEVWTVFEDRDKNIWFSSEGFGVYRLDPAADALRNYSTKEGLGVLAVQTIYQDREGTMWFGGGGGLYRLEGDSMVHVKRNGPWR